MQLYFFAGCSGTGKTKTVKVLAKYFTDLGYRVATFQRYKRYSDVCRYWGFDHFILPPKAFDSYDELVKWLPVGFDIGLVEFGSYAYLDKPGVLPSTAQAFRLIPENSVNELISFGIAVPNRDTVIGYTKVPLGVDTGVFSVNTAFQVSGVDHLASISVVPEWVVPTRDISVLATGVIPPEYAIIYPYLNKVDRADFVSRIAEADFGIVGFGQSLYQLEDDLPAVRLDILCLYPPAFIPYASYPSIHFESLLYAESTLPEYFYDCCLGALSVQREPGLTIYNGPAPARYVDSCGDLR